MRADVLLRIVRERVLVGVRASVLTEDDYGI